VSALTESANLTLSMGGQTIPGKIVRYARYPGGSRQEIDVMGQKIVLAYDAEGKSGFQSAGGQTRDLEGAQLAEAADDLARDLVACLRDPSAYSPQWIGEGDVKGAKADIVLMKPPGLASFKLFVDRTTHHIVKQEYRGTNMQGVPVDQEVFLEDYRKAGPLLLPHKTSVLQDGQPAMGYESTGFSWDPIPAEKFKKG
jgi:hypothetical protein